MSEPLSGFDLDFGEDRTGAYTYREQEHIAELKQQLAAERAKVAMAVETLRKLFYAAEPVADAFAESLFAEVCAVLNQSSDALADIRREVARECVAILKGVEDRYSKHSFPMHPADVAAACAYVIRANFGVLA